jgi:glycosyltransferase involved in cell wall biosynthesis
VLLKAWDQLRPAEAELHIWSSMRLYGPDQLDDEYRSLYEFADTLPGVIYHGIVPNEELRLALRDIHFLTYPSTFPETSCLSVIEAMATGCRVVAPYLGALPETTAGYARLYSSRADEDEHAAAFSRVLAAELANPWNGDPELVADQQRHCGAIYGWARREHEWRQLVAEISLPRGSDVRSGRPSTSELAVTP